MNKSRRIILFSILILSFCFARSKRVAQIPNGSVFNCSNCHISAAGGGGRTDFGEDINSNYLSGAGDVIWGSAIANLDSDNDTFTNGFELGDPNGSWTTGSAAPGNVALVTNPGDASSLDILKYTQITNFSLEQNHPNPFNPNTVINYQLPIASEIKLTIYDVNGKLIRELVNNFQNEGAKSVSWNGKDESGQMVSGGIYIYYLKADNYHNSQKMLLLK